MQQLTLHKTTTMDAYNIIQAKFDSTNYSTISHTTNTDASQTLSYNIHRHVLFYLQNRKIIFYEYSQRLA